MKKIVLIFCLIFTTSFISAQTKEKQDTVTTADGLKYIILRKGNGIQAKNGMKVAVNYTGYLLNRKEFDSSYKRGKPLKFILGEGRVIRGWDEGIALMHVGDKFRLIIPPKLGYGKAKAGKIPPNSTLIFNTELMSAHIPKLSLADTLLMAMFAKGIDSAESRFHKILRTDKNKYDLDSDQLNSLGYRLMQSNYREPAVKIFEMNAELHPDSYEVLNELGKAYMYTGKRQKAIETYKKSLKLDPNNKEAKNMLNKLEKG